MDPFSLQQKHIRDTVEDLLEKYREDSYMSAKLHNYICVQLSTILENNKRRHEESQQRIAELTVEQDEFMERFLNAHLYFYVSTTERFASYDGEQYKLDSEDTVLHHIFGRCSSRIFWLRLLDFILALGYLSQRSCSRISTSGSNSSEVANRHDSCIDDFFLLYFCIF